VGSVQLALVLLHRVLDRAQAPHPHERPAQCAYPRVGVRPEVAQPLPQRLPHDGAAGEVGLEDAALLAVARRLGEDRALAHDLLPLPLIHVVSLPSA
jgi:hypothetical protein